MSLSENEAELVELAIQSADRLALKLEHSLAVVRSGGEVTVRDLLDARGARAGEIDLFLKHFTDAFEAGRRLFRAALIVWEEPQDNLGYVDMLNRVEKIGVLSSASSWREISKVRNSVIHEYAMRPDQAVAAIRAAVPQGEATLELLRVSTEAVRKRRVIRGNAP